MSDLRINNPNGVVGGRNQSDSSSPSPKTISDFPVELPKFSGNDEATSNTEGSEHVLRPRDSKSDTDESTPSICGAFKKKKSAWCKVGQRVVVKQTNAKAVIVSMSGAWINIQFDEQSKPGKPRGFRVSDLRRECADGEEEDDEEDGPTQDDGDAAPAPMPMRRSSRRAAQPSSSSSFAASISDDDEDERGDYDEYSSTSRRVRRCEYLGARPRTSVADRDYFQGTGPGSRLVPLFQTFHHLPLHGEEAACGLLLESLAVMRELKRIRKEDADERKLAAAEEQEEESVATENDRLSLKEKRADRSESGLSAPSSGLMQTDGGSPHVHKCMPGNDAEGRMSGGSPESSSSAEFEEAGTRAPATLSEL